MAAPIGRIKIYLSLTMEAQFDYLSLQGQGERLQKTGASLLLKGPLGNLNPICTRMVRALSVWGTVDGGGWSKYPCIF